MTVHSLYVHFWFNWRVYSKQTNKNRRKSKASIHPWGQKKLSGMNLWKVEIKVSSKRGLAFHQAMCPLAVGDRKLKSQHDRWCNAQFADQGGPWQPRTRVDSDLKALVATLVSQFIF